MNHHSHVDWGRVRRLLIVLPSWVGDAVMATPLLAALRRDERLRAARLLAYMRPGLDELLDGCGLLDEMIVGRPSGLLGPWREGRRLRAMGFDAAILLPNSWRVAATVRAAGVPIRIGYRRSGRGPLLSHGLPCPSPGGWKEPISAIDYYLALGQTLGIDASDRRMLLRASEAQQRAAEELLEKAGIEPGVAFAVLNPGASKAEKRWPADRFAALADHLAARGLKVLINASPGEKPLVQSVVLMTQSEPVNLAALGISLGSLKAILPHARLLVTNDTGTRHIASASANAIEDEQCDRRRVAIISLFGPTDPRWAAIADPRERLIVASDGRIESVAIEQVAAACDEALAKAP